MLFIQNRLFSITGHNEISVFTKTMKFYLSAASVDSLQNSHEADPKERGMNIDDVDLTLWWQKYFQHTTSNIQAFRTANCIITNIDCDKGLKIMRGLEKYCSLFWMHCFCGCYVIFAGTGEAFWLKITVSFICCSHVKYMLVQLSPVMAAILMDDITTVGMLLYSRTYQ